MVIVIALPTVIVMAMVIVTVLRSYGWEYLDDFKHHNVLTRVRGLFLSRYMYLYYLTNS